MRIITVFEPITFGALATGRTGGASVNELLRAELLGGTTYALMRKAACPVLVVPRAATG